ncbi:hypothetical protein BCR44DRAFT_1176245 [Catenaria anguillulae PL171]|uniref:Uncharacterized protein n=1 Tax=Catenaria anguillulae PL171 TaxID=765915 RepID=A0A1Y2I1D2_9FUNG|nr:hypothetical protein BCR44DRAFT_1176245 [Catenaria anguillulae PL171]
MGTGKSPIGAHIAPPETSFVLISLRNASHIRQSLLLSTSTFNFNRVHSLHRSRRRPFPALRLHPLTHLSTQHNIQLKIRSFARQNPNVQPTTDCSSAAGSGPTPTVHLLRVGCHGRGCWSAIPTAPRAGAASTHTQKQARYRPGTPRHPSHSTARARPHSARWWRQQQQRDGRPYLLVHPSHSRSHASESRSIAGHGRHVAPIPHTVASWLGPNAITQQSLAQGWHAAAVMMGSTSAHHRPFPSPLPYRHRASLFLHLGDRTLTLELRNVYDVAAQAQYANWHVQPQGAPQIHTLGLGRGPQVGSDAVSSAADAPSLGSFQHTTTSNRPLSPPEAPKSGGDRDLPSRRLMVSNNLIRNK